MPGIDINKLEKYADKVYNRANYFNEYTLKTIGRRLKEIGLLSAYDQDTLKNMADISGDMEAITRELARVTELNVRDIENIYSQTIKEGVNSYKPLYDFKNIPFVPFKDNEYVQFLVKHWAKSTSEEMINLSRTKALSFTKYNHKGDVTGVTPLSGAFQKAVDDAVIAVSSGTADINTVIRETVENLGGSGVRVNYGSGVTRRLDTVVRQNLLYGAKKANQAYDDYVCEKLGCDGFEVDYHPNPRKSHAFMGGEVFSCNGRVKVNDRIYEDGSEALERLEDYGCLHLKFGMILGVSEPNYSKEELKEMHEKDTELVEYDGIKKTRYEWKQAQRQLETKVRQEKDISVMAKAAGDNDREKKANEKINVLRSKYDDLCSKTGLQPTLERMVVNDKKVLTKGGNGDIMYIEGEGMYRKTKGDKIEPMPKKQFFKIVKRFRDNGGIMQFNDETDEFLKREDAEAVTYNSKTILIRQNPGRASVFEELIHATQYRLGENDGSYLSRLKCEIFAQEKLLKNSKSYKLTKKEIEQTKRALVAYKKELNEYYKQR